MLDNEICTYLDRKSPVYDRNLELLLRDLEKNFGSLTDIAHADVSQFPMSVTDNHYLWATIKLACNLAIMFTKKELEDRPVIAGSDFLDQYAQARLRDCINMEIECLFLNSSGRLIGSEILMNGAVDYIHFYPREIIKKCLEWECSQFVIIHTNPKESGVYSFKLGNRVKQLYEASHAIGIPMISYLFVSIDGTLELT